ncbi:hypothetical protein CASFOL_001907 [Castilleja foliolosa]|uniref:Uncharacterized protein n=1 Tax=Castilleja foliolosa TaxID=1961234 RepID=A0ABD3EGB9_9LAMI
MEVNTTDHASTSTAIPQANVEIHADGDAINKIDETVHPLLKYKSTSRLYFHLGRGNITYLYVNPRYRLATTTGTNFIKSGRRRLYMWTKKLLYKGVRGMALSP